MSDNKEAVTDLSQCEREQIQYINKIQSFAYAFAFYHFDLSIHAYSENIAELIPSMVTSKTLEQCLPAEVCASITGEMEKVSQSIGRTTLVTIDKHSYVMSLYVADSSLIYCTLEKSPALAVIHHALGLKKHFNHFLEQFNDLTQVFYTQCADWIRQHFQFDRVLIYEFDDNYNGLVVGKSRSSVLGSLMDHHFPASDIPKQARKLYLSNRARLVCNANDEGVQLNYRNPADDTEKPVNLSTTDTRDLSAIHKEYLKNMGVKASLSISLIVDGKLWGLIACHNKEEQYIDYYTRQLCEHISHTLSRYIQSMLLYAQVEETKYIHQKLYKYQLEILDANLDFDSLTIENRIFRAIDAEYIAIVDHKTVLTDHPSFDHQKYKQFYELDCCTAEKPLFFSSTLAKDYPAFFNQDDHYAGMMVVCISEKLQRYLFLFRDSITKEITWGGDPNKPTTSFQGQINPRESFESWVQTIKDESEPWDKNEIKFAENLGLMLRTMK